MTPSSNTLLKILAAGLAVVAVWVLVGVSRQRSSLRPADAGPPAAATVAPHHLSETEQARLTADGDTPRDTVATLIAEVKGLKREVGRLTADNQQLRRENADLSTLENKIQARLDARADQYRQQADQRSQAVEERLSQANQALTGLQQRLRAMSSATSSAVGSDIPVGFGLRAGEGLNLTESVVWIEPLQSGGANGAQRPGKARAQEAANAVQPRYTINRDATLLGSVALTALIGRIPVGAQVQDPYPFKVLVGADNLAANGLQIPGLDAMVMSGTATGDWALSCVRGEISSATFVFEDGTIRSFPKPQPGDADAKRGRTAAFGYLSDPYGMPCIAGQRRTNAAAYLSTRVGLAAAQAAAEAAAAAETSTVTSGQAGTVTSAVTGSPSVFARQKAIASGIEEAAQWIRERQAQSFDAVVVPTGAAVAIHIDAEIPIDYDPQGRRLSHRSDGHAQAVRRTLD